MADRSNEEWSTLIKDKINSVNATAATLPSEKKWTTQDLARTIDHTLLKPDAQVTQIDALCDEALKHNFKSCCVNGVHIKQVAERLRASNGQTIPCAVIGFPLGASSTLVKAFETSQAVSDGALEIDMVISIGHLKSCQYHLVYADILAVVKAAHPVPVKVIIETVFLSPEEIIAASFISAEANAAFVKTSTGFSGGGATKEDVELMKRTVQYKGDGVVKVKASAGVRTWDKSIEVLNAGADRIGTSSGVAIMENRQGSGY
ncbi:hypothetical protein DL96DRAFT_1712320 [Flagelloscypha sp. PMI_526]|nr:hypothetical protein DL96DRAFT_1712320 [Flagelloscypha sp. PMI_526]